MLAAPLTEPAAVPFPLPKVRGLSFQDSFTADASGGLPSLWTPISGASTAAKLQAGLLHFAPTTADSVLRSAAPAWTDMEVECLCRVTSGPASSWLGPAARVAANGACYALITYYGNSNTGLFRFNSPGSGVNLGSVALSPPMGVWALVRIRCVAKSITGTVSWGTSSVTISATDTTFASGPPGLTFSSNGGNGCTGDFSWLRAVKL